MLNECRRKGKVTQAKGKAKVVDKATGAKLKVTFFWPFYGDYWIIKLGNDYDYAVVGTPNRKYLWILNRTPQMDDKLFSQLIEFVKSKVSMSEALSKQAIAKLACQENCRIYSILVSVRSLDPCWMLMTRK